MLAIKLRRIGKKHQASYRIIFSEKRSKVSGQNVEDLGWFNPLTKTHKLEETRVRYWLGQGAQPTDTVHNFLVRVGVISGEKRSVHKTKKKEENKT